MGDIYVNGELIPNITSLRAYLPDDLPLNTRIALDTETSGLFVDGDWDTNPSDCSPPARCSVVSLAWIAPKDEGCEWCGGIGCNACVTELALPFDQGWIGGKPGTWDQNADTFFILPHTEECIDAQHGQFPFQHKESSILTVFNCVCAPWNLPNEAWHELINWLQGRALVMHHKKFDCHIVHAGLREDIRCSVGTPGLTYEGLCQCYGYDLMPQVVWDTQTAQGLIEPLEKSSLKPTMQRLYGETEGDEKAKVEAALRKQGKGLTKRYDLLNWSIIGPYASKDAQLTIRLFKHQQAQIQSGEIDPNDVKLLTELEFPLSQVLYNIENRGIGFDAEKMREEAVKMRKAVADLKAQLPFSPPNVTQAKKYFFGPPPEGLGLIPIKTTVTCQKCGYNTQKRTSSTAKKYQGVVCYNHEGAPSLDAEVVSRLAADNVPGAELWKDIANNESALQKWYTSWPYKAGPDGRLRTNFRQGRVESDRKGANSGGAISGRLSAERIQAQGVPQEWRIPKGITPVKKLFRAKPGYQLWELDQSNAEVRVGAWVSQCKALVERINSGENIHDSNTKLIFGIDESHPEWEWYRTSAKRGIFGRMYAAGLRTLKSQIDNDLKADVPEGKIRAFMEMLDNTYPEFSRTARLAQRKADKGMGGCGFVRLVTGRRRVFGWGEKTYKAFNAIIQGGVAEVMKEWMLVVENVYPGVLVNQVHDSIWIEIPNEPYESHIEINAETGKEKTVYDTFPTVVADIKRMGEELFTYRFSTPELKINFTVDAKRLA